MKYMKGTLKVVLFTLLSSLPNCLSNILSVNVKGPFMFCHLIMKGI